MGFKNPAMIGEQSFEGVSQKVDEEEPQAGGKEDGTQHSAGLHWHIVSAQKRHNTPLVMLSKLNDEVKQKRLYMKI